MTHYIELPNGSFAPVQSTAADITTMKHQLRHIDEMVPEGFTIDTCCYPPLAYKGPRFAMDSSRTQRYSCYTELESMLMRELELTQAGAFLRDDRSLRDHEPEHLREAYSLCTKTPFIRHAVFQGKRPWAVAQAYKLFKEGGLNVGKGDPMPPATVGWETGE